MSATRKWFSSLASLQSRHDLKRALLRSVPVQSLPLRLRPAFLLLTTITMLILALLGFHPTLATKISPPVPFSDKLLHFICFFIASAQFYAIWVVEPTSRDSIWRNYPEMLSILVCVLFGAIGSEFVQSLLPYKTFQYGDVIANVLGSSLGITLARILTIRHQRTVELRRLYQPLNLNDFRDSDQDSDEEELPTAQSLTARNPKLKLEENPWDHDETEIFGLGDDD